MSANKFTLEAWLKSQQIDLSGQTGETIASLRRAFEKILLDVAVARQSVMFSEPCPLALFELAVNGPE